VGRVKWLDFDKVPTRWNTVASLTAQFLDREALRRRRFDYEESAVPNPSKVGLMARVVVTGRRFSRVTSQRRALGPRDEVIVLDNL